MMKSLCSYKTIYKNFEYKFRSESRDNEENNIFYNKAKCSQISVN